jgi:hypothetical protein
MAWLRAASSVITIICLGMFPDVRGSRLEVWLGAHYRIWLLRRRGAKQE